MKYIASLLLIVALFTGCSKDEAYIPDVAVNYNITTTEFSLKATNNVLLVPNYGIAGLIIVKTPVGGYVAFDRCSSVNPEQRCKVNPDDNGLSATDPCSGAKFSLLDGSPVKAPAKKNLKAYNVYLQGGQLLNITN